MESPAQPKETPDASIGDLEGLTNGVDADEIFFGKRATGLEDKLNGLAETVAGLVERYWTHARLAA